MDTRNVGLVLAVMAALALPIRAAACTSVADCNDGNPCTDELCDPQGVCVYAKVNNACEDGNACSTNDTCNAGACIGGSVASGCTACQAIAVLPAEGGTFVGVTAGTGSLTSSCGVTAPSPERVYRWTPISSGPATIATCGTGTLYDSVLHVRTGTCTGAEIACNDDTAGCPTGEPNDHHGSRLSLTVTAGQTYVIAVDGYNGARGTYTMTVTPPSFCGNGLREGSEICDGADASACPSGQCTNACDCAPPPTGLPDLVPQITGVSLAFNATVASGDVVEGCAEATTGVDLLRFGAYSRNDGNADLVLGDPLCPTPCDQHPLEVCGNPDFICSPAQGHNHAHYNNYARYDLLDQNGQSIVVGHKQGYCLRDTNCATPFYTCVNQGITAGCSDLYGAQLGCQYLDITGVPSGTYTLRVTIDPFDRIPELSEANNVTQQSVTIVRPSPTSTAPTPTRTATPSRTPTPTVPPSVGTATPSPTPTPSATGTPTPSATLTPSPSATATPTPTSSATPAATSTLTATTVLTSAPTVTPSPSACPIAGIIPATGGTVIGTTSGAGNRSGTCAATALSPEAIYQFTPATSGTATFSTCGSATRYDTVVYVRSDTCTGTQLGCNDDVPGCETGEPNDHHGSRFSINVAAGRTYFVFVDGFNGAAGAYALTTVLVAATPTRTASPTPSASPTPAPNACTLATAIGSEGGTFSGTTAGSNTLTGSCASTNVSPEQVYQWIPARSGTALIETCGAPTLFDTVVSIRQTTCVGGAERACNDDTAGCTTGEPNDHHGSRLSVQVTAGQTYYVIVDGYGGTRGAFQLRIVPP